MTEKDDTFSAVPAKKKIPWYFARGTLLEFDNLK